VDRHAAKSSLSLSSSFDELYAYGTRRTLTRAAHMKLSGTKCVRRGGRIGNAVGKSAASITDM
jgi:hypothetical protein